MATTPRRRLPPPRAATTYDQPMRSGISVEDMDREVRPQDDLFGYVNGGWVARTQIPSDRALHGTFRILADDAEQHLRAIVEEAAASDAAPGTPARKVGDLYAAFLDEARIRELGLDPVRDDLDRALAVQEPSDLLRQLGSLQRRGVRGAVELYVMTDKRDSTRYLPYLEQSGIGLPDESYYREDTFAGIRRRTSPTSAACSTSPASTTRRRAPSGSWRWRPAWRRRTGTGCAAATPSRRTTLLDRTPCRS